MNFSLSIFIFALSLFFSDSFSFNAFASKIQEIQLSKLGTTYIQMEAVARPNSGKDACGFGMNKQIVDARVNGKPVELKLVEALYFNDEQSKICEIAFYHANISKSELQVSAKNEFTFSLNWLGASKSVAGFSEVHFKFINGQGLESNLCTVHYGYFSTIENASCHNGIYLETIQVSSKDAARAEKLRKYSNDYDYALSYFEGDFAVYEKYIGNLEAAFKKVKNKNIDDLNTADISGNSLEAQELREILEQGKKEREKQIAEAQEAAKKADEAIVMLGNMFAVLSEKIGLLPELLPFFSLPEPIFSGEEDAAQETIFQELANEAISEIQNKFEGGDKRAMVALAHNFLKRIEEWRNLADYSGRANAAVLNDYAKGVNNFQNYLFSSGCNGKGCFHQNMWLKNSAIPQNVQSDIDGVFAQYNTQKAKQLKEALQAIDQKALAKYGKQLSNTFLTIQAMAEILRANSLAVAEGNAPPQENVDALFNSVVQVATFTAKLSIGFTPVGDAIDLYELVEGKNFYSGEELNVWERSLSSLGLVVGTSSLWRKMGAKFKNLDRTLEVLKWRKALVKSEDLAKLVKAADNVAVDPAVFGTFKDSNATIGELTKDIVVLRYWGKYPEGSHSSLRGSDEFGRFFGNTIYQNEEEFRKGAVVFEEWNSAKNISFFKVKKGTKVAYGKIEMQTLVEADSASKVQKNIDSSNDLQFVFANNYSEFADKNKLFNVLSNGNVSSLFKTNSWK
jgi:Pre-toxin TG